MKRETTMKQPKNLVLLTVSAVIAVLLLCAAPAAAAELVAGTPVTNEETGVITVPIILENDLSDFVGFSANVENDIPGVVITIGDERPITGAGYMVNSREANEKQILNAMFYDSETANSGISDPEITLFTINVRITDPSVTNVPLSITLRELLSASEGDIPLDTVKQIDVSNLRLTDTVTAAVTSVGKEEEVPEYVPPAPVVPTYTSQPTEQPTDMPVQQPTEKPSGTPSSPGFGAVAGILGLFAGAGLVRSRIGRK